MIKRTLVFTTSGSLRLHLRQLVWEGEDGRSSYVPIEDIGFVILESPLITVSTALLRELCMSNAAVVICDASHMPGSYLLPVAGHTMCQKVMGMQIALSAVKKDILWAQTVKRKIFNQGCVAKKYNLLLGRDLVKWSKEVRRGDPGNIEAQAARAYFTVFTMDEMCPFHRSPTGPMPNPALNYGYAILRAAVARALVSAGLNCMMGIHHHNQYDPYCLADDIMEPYRPFVDMLILENYSIFEKSDELTPEMKKVLLGLLVMDVEIGKMKRPLMNALSLTAASIVRVISGKDEEIEYPKVEVG